MSLLFSTKISDLTALFALSGFRKTSLADAFADTFQNPAQTPKSEKSENHCGSGPFNGADGRARTGGLILAKEDFSEQ